MLANRYISTARRALGLLLALVLSLFLLAGCAAESGGTIAPGNNSNSYRLIESGKLIVGSDCDYPPFIALENGEVVGFEYEFMQEIAKILGLELQYLPPQNFDSLLASVAAGTAMDISVSSLTITPERQKLVDFSTPYFDSNQAVVVLKGSGITSIDQLEGLTISSQSGTTGSEWALENIPGAAQNLREFTQTSDALVALQAGEVKAVILDQPVAAEQVATTFTSATIIAEIPTGEQYGIAVSKDNPALNKAISDAIDTLIKNGTYERIFAKYFSFAPTIVAK